MNEAIDTEFSEKDEMSPYGEAYDFVVTYWGASSTIGMAKLILTLYNPRHPFGFGECTSNFDCVRCDLATRVVAHYLQYGEDEELRIYGREIVKSFPHLLELSDAANEAKDVIRRKWQAEHDTGYENSEN